MPSLSTSHGLTQLSKAVLIGLSTTLLLTACGSDSPTARRAPAVDEKPEVTYALTVRSAFRIKNAQIRLINAITGAELAKKELVDGTELKFDVKASNANANLLVAEISGKDSTASYFDPTLNAYAPLTTPLHASIAMPNSETVLFVSPFSEIAFQRALVRSNSFDATRPDYTKLRLVNVAYANNEVFSTFFVNPTLLLPAISSLDDLNKLLINTKDIKNPPNTTPEYLSTFYGLGHINLQHLEHNSNANRDLSPVLSFTKRASADMRDGSLDGMGLAGDGINGTVYLADPMLTPQVPNSDPKLNTKAGLEATQQATRENYAGRLKPALLDFLSNSLKSTDQAGINYFNSVNYITGATALYPEFLPSALVPRSIGTGNFKQAFGLGQIKLTKEPQKILDGSCKETLTGVNPDAGKAGVPDQFVNIDCQIGANADGTVGAYNAIENLVGTYTTTDNSCRLSINFDGKVTLSNGAKSFDSSFSSTVNRDFSDVIFRLEPNIAVTPDKQRYLLNVASAERNPPEFIQIRTEGQNIMSAVAGTMNIKSDGSAPDPFPMRLDNEKLNCTGFKPVFSKP